jgi:NAD(P)-dependent dehydrogenase (short-subunit alcohol dehydrogenase family)
MSSQIALITGGSRGLGKSTALNLARKGVDVIVTYRQQQVEAEAVVREIQASGVKAAALPLDQSNNRAFASFAADLKGLLNSHWQREQLDILVNNAGVGIQASFAETTEAQFDQLMSVHFKGVFFLTQQLLPVIADGGRILNVSTGLARFTSPGYAAYAAMKGAIETLTRYQAKELGARGISVNVFAPGATATEFGGGHLRNNEELRKFLSAQTAMGRVGEAEDIGSSIASLLTSDSNWITGQRIEASGGMFL